MERQPITDDPRSEVDGRVDLDVLGLHPCRLRLHRGRDAEQVEGGLVVGHVCVDELTRDRRFGRPRLGGLGLRREVLRDAGHEEADQGSDRECGPRPTQAASPDPSSTHRSSVLGERVPRSVVPMAGMRRKRRARLQHWIRRDGAIRMPRRYASDPSRNGDQASNGPSRMGSHATCGACMPARRSLAESARCILRDRLCPGPPSAGQSRGSRIRRDGDVHRPHDAILVRARNCPPGQAAYRVRVTLFRFRGRSGSTPRAPARYIAWSCPTTIETIGPSHSGVPAASANGHRATSSASG